MEILLGFLILVVKISALVSSLLFTGLMLYSINKNKDITILIRDRASGIFLLFITSITIYLVIK